MKTPKKILVVSRSTQNCLEAVETGISIARQHDAKLYVMHVIHDPFSLEGWNLPAPNFHAEIEKMIVDARKDLENMVRAEKEKGLPVLEWVKNGPPAEEIRKVVEQEGIDLVIMTAHPEGRLEHFLFGRTNDAIIRSLPASLLLVKNSNR